MKSREEMLSILRTMDDSHLMKALEATGIDCGSCLPGASGLSDREPDRDEGIASWNATQVVVPGSKRPKLFDKSAYVEQAPSAPTRTMQLPQEQFGMEDLQPNPLTRL